MPNILKKRPFRKHIDQWHSNNKFNIVNYEYALVSCNFKYITKNQVESCRKVISRIVRRQKKKPFYKHLFNFTVVATKKSSGARMGRGKGPIKSYLATASKNSILYIFKRSNLIFIKSVLQKVQRKLPLKLKVVSMFKNGYCRNSDRCWR